MRTIIVAALSATLLTAAVPAIGSAKPLRPVRAAFVHDCNQNRYYVRYRLGAVASIMSVRNMRCRTALRVVRRHGRSASGGRHFRLGRFRCHRYYHNYEDNKARCVRGRHAFRVDYGS
jgi:hypothetical protein